MKTILFIEDNINLHQIYRDALESEDIELICVTTGQQGLDRIKVHKPDLVILDVMLPGGMNGFDVLEQMKRDQSIATIPVLILTNLDSERKTAMSIGAIDYLVKADTSIDEVVKKIKTLLNIH